LIDIFENLLKMNTYKSKRNFSEAKIFFIIFLINIFLCQVSKLKAQVVVDTTSYPSGYTTGQLSFRNALEVDSLNNLWIGFKNIGAGKFDGTNWTMYNYTNGLPSNKVLAFAFSGNDIWFGTDSGVAKFNGSSWMIYNSSNSGLTSYSIQCLFADGNNLWVGTKAGAFVFDGSTWTNYTAANSGLLSDSIYCFAKTGNDTMLIGTGNGFSKFHNGIWTSYTLTSNSGSSTSETIVISPATKFVADLSGNIWIQAGKFPYQFYTYYIFSNNTVERLSSYFPFCHMFPSIRNPLIGINSIGKIVTTGFFEVNINPIDEWETPFYLAYDFPNTYFDLDLADKVWFAPGGINTYILSIDYRNSLQAVVADSNCHSLDINNVQASVWNNGSMFWDLQNTGQYEVPKGSGKNTMFADGFWIGGKDPSGNLHIAAQTYRQSGNDFWPGPVDTITPTIDPVTYQQYDNIWKIDRLTVDAFITQFGWGNVTNGSYPVPDVILQWPAQGSGNYSRNLAPFVDYNNDGLYNPYDGDYPDIKGDQMLWCVFNDVHNVHTETNGSKLGIEVQCSAYAYNCPLVNDSESVINNTTFYHYKIFNRSANSYDSVYVGKFTNINLGNSLDDYIGCDSALNIAYTYNGDNIDDGSTGYGFNPPIQNIVYLSDTMKHAVFYDNNFSIMGHPTSASHYYSYMKSFWKDGTRITYGGNGNGSGTGATNTPTNFMYPGNPYDPAPSTWNETNAGNTPGDRRMMTSAGPFSFPAQSEKDFDIAYVWTRDNSAPNGLTTSWAKNVHDVLKVKQWYENDSFPCNNSYIGIHEINKQVSLNVYPNPATDDITVFVANREKITWSIEVTDFMGRTIRKGVIFSNRNNKINLDGLASGIYFVRISNEENFAVKKFVKE
jgi:hypothetical protein